MYSLTLSTLIAQLLPTFMRTTRMIAWLNVLLAPLQTFINTTWAADVIDYSRKVQYNGQVIYMEAILNIVFNADGTDLIYIEDAADIEYDYLYNLAEGGQVTYLFNEAESEAPYYLSNSSEYALLLDFVVMVPQTLYDSMVADDTLDQVTALVNYYKLAGKRFSINPFTP